MGPRPKLRPLEVFPVEIDGTRLICLRDPAGLTEQVALVPVPVLRLLALFDGTRDLAALQADFVRAGGDLLGRDAIAELVERLDGAFLLEGPRFQAHLAELAAECLAAPSRPAAHAGTSYPAEPETLRAFLDGFFAEAEAVEAAAAAAAPPPRRPAGARRPARAPRRRRPPPVRAVVAPHIDFNRGGRVYALAYRPLLGEPPPDLYVVLGTDHNGDGSLYSLGRRAYDTPLGAVAVDEESAALVARRAGHVAPPTAEVNHRKEHSIEFQAVMLRYLAARRGDGAGPPMLPILCGSFHELVAGGDPAADQRIADLCGAVAEAVAGRRVVFVAAADLAHVGPNFGDERPLGPADLEALAAHDAALLEAVTAVDAAAFFALLREERDARRVCGLPPIYTLLRLCGATRGEVLGYDQCLAGGEGDSRVSIAAAVLRA